MRSAVSLRPYLSARIGRSELSADVIYSIDNERRRTKHALCFCSRENSSFALQHGGLKNNDEGETMKRSGIVAAVAISFAAVLLMRTVSAHEPMRIVPSVDTCRVFAAFADLARPRLSTERFDCPSSKSDRCLTAVDHRSPGLESRSPITDHRSLAFDHGSSVVESLITDHRS